MRLKDFLVGEGIPWLTSSASFGPTNFQTRHGEEEEEEDEPDKTHVIPYP